jgi:hypothetical protein
MKQSAINLSVVAAFAMAASGAANAQLSEVGGFGQSTNSSANFSYMPGRYMQWNSGSTFQAYCIDPFTGTAFPGTYAQMTLDAFTTGGTSSSYASQIGRVSYSSFGLSKSTTAQTQVRNDIKELFGWAYSDATSGNTAKAAAFGLVLWEIVMQNWGTSTNAYSATSGTFTTLGGDGTLNNFTTSEATSADKVEYWVDQYLKALNGTIGWTTVLGAGASLKDWNYTVYFAGESPRSQTFISVTPRTVAVPATLALAGVALLALAGVRRKQAR